MTKIFENFSLKNLNTFGINVSTRLYAEFSTIAELSELLNYCAERGEKWYILGGGANVLFTTDFDGMIIRSRMRNIKLNEHDLVVADAGVEWDDLVAWGVERGLGGLENLSYIPGSVGASPIQNIGAYGVEAKDSIEWVEFLNITTMQIERKMNDECGFGYRESVFKRGLKGQIIVLRVAFRLNENVNAFNINYGDVCLEVEKRGGASLKTIREAITFIRKSKLPEPAELGNAGSFFKNPIVSAEKFEQLLAKYEDLKWFDSECGGKKIPAGWLIERAGWKGRKMGNVGVHERQALVLVNYGNATGEEVLSLAAQVQQAVKEIFEVDIELEVNIL